MSEHLDVAVVGAGPFGLSAGAFLRDRACRVFGVPMHTWRSVMPPAMILRSTWAETSIASPADCGSIDAWVEAGGGERREPIPLTSFLAYADWFRERWVGETDPATVEHVEASGRGYRLTTSAGDEVDARHLVVAVGALPFSVAPPALADEIDGEVVQFATRRVDGAPVAGRRITIVGSGQTALESAAVLLGQGAEVEVVVRSHVHWFSDREEMAKRGRLGEWLYGLAYPVVGFGPPPFNRLVQHPGLFARLPYGVRERLNRRLLRPGGSPWLRGQVEGRATITEGRQVVRLERSAGGVQVVLDDGSVRESDRVLVATGFRFDSSALGFLSDELRGRLALRDGWPALDRHFRSVSEPGISLVGYPAEGQFGPMSRFVVGTQFTSPRLADGVPGPAGRVLAASAGLRRAA